MKVVVAIPVYNRAATLGRAIESAISQAEVVVVDDCSTDGSLAVAAQYPVRIVRHARKREDWIHALDAVIAGLDADYIVGMGADDVLYPGLTSAVEAAAGAGVVFCDYDLLREGDPPAVVETRRYGFDAPTALDAAQVRQRFSGSVRRFECAVGSAIRADALAWLRCHDYLRLGPWADSWGYAAAAARFGCAYVPGPLAGFVVEQAEPSYHQRVLQDPGLVDHYRREGAAWAAQPEIAALGVTFAI